MIYLDQDERGRMGFACGAYDLKALCRSAHLSWSQARKIWHCPARPAFGHLLLRRFHDSLFQPAALAEARRLEEEHADRERFLQELAEARTDDLLLEQLGAGIVWPAKLMRHQRHSILGALVFERFGFFLEMGTGKTLAALAAFQILRDLGLVDRLLVCCPPRLQHEAWSRQAAEHLGWQAHVLEGRRQERALAVASSKHEMIVCSHTAIRENGKAYAKAVADGRWMVIFDESSRLGGGSSQQAAAAIRISEQAERVLLLTGTPFAGKLERLFRQLRLLDGGALLGTSYSRLLELARELGAPLDWQGRVEWGRAPAFATLIQAAIDSCSVQWKRAECVDLPERTFRTLKVEMTVAQKAAYLQTKVKDVGALRAMGIPVAAAKALNLAQVTSGFVRAEDGTVTFLEPNPKLQALLQLFEDELEGVKTIVWVRFHAELDLVANGLRKHGISVVEFSGRVNDSGKEEALARFRAPMGAQVLLATAETGGYGLSLNEASAMVFYSVGYDWEVYSQACDRNQRVGQTARCTVFQLLCGGSVDVKISEILRKKGRLRDLILD